MTLSEIHKALQQHGYISNPYIDFAVSGAMSGTPLLVEGTRASERRPLHTRPQTCWDWNYCASSFMMA